MVIQNESKSSPFLSLLLPQTKKCALFKHHVPESDQSLCEKVSNILNSEILPDSEKMKNKDKGSRKRSINNLSSSSESKESVEITIDPEDLKELRSVYRKCKAVVKKIETKYGHILNLNEQEVPRNSESDNNEETSKCECTANKKIIFDDEGKEITAETDLDNHICPKKLKIRRSHVEFSLDEPRNNLQVEYETPDTMLPDDLHSLNNILHNPEIEVTHRNRVISKIKMMKQEYIDEIRFNKQSLIEKIKADPEDMLEFRGTNLKSLPGYKC